MCRRYADIYIYICICMYKNFMHRFWWMYIGFLCKLENLQQKQGPQFAHLPMHRVNPLEEPVLIPSE